MVMKKLDVQGGGLSLLALNRRRPTVRIRMCTRGLRWKEWCQPNFVCTQYPVHPSKPKRDDLPECVEVRSNAFNEHRRWCKWSSRTNAKYCANVYNVSADFCYWQKSLLNASQKKVYWSLWTFGFSAKIVAWRCIAHRWKARKILCLPMTLIPMT